MAEQVAGRSEAEARRGLDRLRGILEAGVVAGVAAGVGMAFWLVVYGAFTDLGALTPLKLIGGTFYGSDALGPGYGAAFWGLVLHLAVSGAFGVLFSAVISPRADPMVAVAAAVAYGLVVWLVMTFGVMPVVDPLMRPRVSTLSTAWFGAHLVYGAILGLAPQLRRTTAPAPRDPRRGAAP